MYKKIKKDKKCELQLTPSPFDPSPWCSSSSPRCGRCASPDLCVVMENGLLVNPCKRIGIVAECVAYCQEPHLYQWEASMVDGTVLPYDPAHFPNGRVRGGYC